MNSKGFMFALAASILSLAGGPASSDRLSGYPSHENSRAKWSYNLVRSPVRAGSVAQMFEVRPGDCGGADCRSFRERSEFILHRGIPFPADVWIAFSVLMPSDFQPGRRTQTKFFQLNVRDGLVDATGDGTTRGRFVSLVNFQVEQGSVTLCTYRFERLGSGWRDECDKTRLTSLDSMRGRWTDFVLNYDSRGSGSLQVLVGGRVAATEADFVVADFDDVYVKYGIYRPQTNREGGPVPRQVLFVDEVRIGGSRGEVAGPGLPAVD